MAKFNLKLYVKISVLFILAFFLIGAVEKQFDGMLYISSDTLTMSWDISTGATRYEVQAVDILHTPETVIDLGNTTDTSLILNKLNTSIYKYRVRACNDAGCSSWAESTDPTYATVNGDAKSWMVYWKISTPTGGGVS